MSFKFFLTIVTTVQILASSKTQALINDFEFIQKPKAPIFPILIPPPENFNQTCFVIKFTSEIFYTVISSDTVSKEVVEASKNPWTFTNCTNASISDQVFPFSITSRLNHTSVLDFEVPVFSTDRELFKLTFTLNNTSGKYGIGGGKALHNNIPNLVLSTLTPSNVTLQAALGNASSCGSYHLYGSTTDKQISVDVSFYNLKFEVIKATVGEFYNVTSFPFSTNVQDICSRNGTTGPGNQQHLVSGVVNLKSISGIVLIIAFVFNCFNF